MATKGAPFSTRAGRRWRRSTHRWRVLPDYLIVGAQKAGTTSLHDLLVRHPDVEAPHVKEPQYFAYNHHRSESWYRSLMPLRIRTWRGLRRRAIVGEASTYYLHHPKAAERAAALVPQAKVIAVLREPAARTESHYRHEVRAGREALSLRDAIAAEPERLAGELERIERGEEARRLPHETQSYLSRSEYGPQIARWRTHYPDDQILIVRFEDLTGPGGGDTVGTILQFLGLRPSGQSFPHRNDGGSPASLDLEWIRGRLLERPEAATALPVDWPETSANNEGNRC